MKCKICKQKTNWNSSFGRREFIVCPNCFNEMVRRKTTRTDKSREQCRNEILTALFDIGDQVKKIKESVD